MFASVKGLFTIWGILVFLLTLFLLDPNKKDGGWGWKGGTNDSMRRMLHKPDGTMRRYSKPLLLLWIVVWIILTWMFIPD